MASWTSSKLDDRVQLRGKWRYLVCVVAGLLMQCTHATEEAMANWLSSPRRGERFFWAHTATKYLRHSSSIVQTVTSSCAVVAESLPPCRNARQTRIRPTATLRIEKTVRAELVEGTGLGDAAKFLFSSEVWAEDVKLVKEENGRSPSLWAEYFGLEAATVTKTSVHFVTAKYHDPSTVVVFDLKGCRPTHLPFNLALCGGRNTSDMPNNSSATSHSVRTLTKQLHFLP